MDKKTITIHSTSNRSFKLWKSLLESRGVKNHHLCLVSGKKIVTEALARHRTQIEFLLATQQEQLDLLAEQFHLTPEEINTKANLLTPELFNQLDQLGTHSPLLVMKTRKVPTMDLSTPCQGLEVLVGCGDPSNAGALIRSATALGVKKIILLQESAHPFHFKSIRSSSGAVFEAPFFAGPSLQSLQKLDDFKISSYSLFALDAQGSSLHRFEWPKDIRLIIGDEGQGVLNFQGPKLSIPMKANSESLNATVAGSIAMVLYNQHHRGKNQHSGVDDQVEDSATKS